MQPDCISQVWAWVQQVPGRGRHEAVGVEKVLFQPEAAEGAIEIAGLVAAHAVPQDQVLRPGWRADRVGLHEAQALQGVGQRHR
jgi:hypothetical protein